MSAEAIIVNPPTLADIERMGLGGRLSYFELERRTAGEEGFRSFPGEHLGLAALTSACRAAGIAAVAVNGQVAYHRTLDETWAAVVDAAPAGPAVIGFSGPCQVFAENLDLAMRARERWPSVVVVFGHDFATLNYDRLLREYDVIDCVVLGEGERSLPAICAAALAGQGLDGIPGTVVRTRGKTAVTAAPLEPLDLDELPWVARDQLPAAASRGLSAGVFSSRGCPYRCTYCTTGQTAGLLHKRLGHRERSVEDVVDEIEMLARDHAIDHLTIVDDLFVTRHERSQARAVRFAERLRSKRLGVPFMIDARVDSIDRATFSALRDAGLHRVFVGVETGSPEQLAFYRKRYGQEHDPSFVRRQMRLLCDLGVEVVPGIITFHPETRADELVTTLEIIDACEYEGTFQFMNRIFAHPGTALWHDYRERNLLDVEWPVPSWRLQSAEASAIEQSVLAAIAAGDEYREVRNVFETRVRQWADLHERNVLA